MGKKQRNRERRARVRAHWDFNVAKLFIADGKLHGRMTDRSTPMFTSATDLYKALQLLGEEPTHSNMNLLSKAICRLYPCNVDPEILKSDFIYWDEVTKYGIDVARKRAPPARLPPGITRADPHYRKIERRS